MRTLIYCGILILSIGSATFGQWNRTTLDRVRQIKLLESSREDVKRILAEYEASDDDDHVQNFSIDGVDIDVSYSSGECDEEEGDADDITAWKINEWKVTKLQVEFTDAIKLKDSGVDVSKFRKEKRNGDDASKYILYSKDPGMAIDVENGEISKIIIFPAKNQSKTLCGTATNFADFYKSDARIFPSIFYPQVIVCYVASVTELSLSVSEIQASSSRLISVKTVAVDPENDVLTYLYNVTAGQVRGSGPSVVWDLTGVGPGTYNLTAGVDDGCGVCGNTMTKTVTIR